MSMVRLVTFAAPPAGYTHEEIRPLSDNRQNTGCTQASQRTAAGEDALEAAREAAREEVRAAVRQAIRNAREARAALDARATRNGRVARNARAIHHARTARTARVTEDARAAQLVLLFNEICGPEYFDEDEQQSEFSTTKLCSVHGDVAEDDTEMHTNVTAACADNHYDETLHICTPCLQEYLKDKMFPLGTGDIRHRFPATTVRCWAPGCFMQLSHSDIQKHADPEVFEIYDQALCERELVNDDLVIRCASPDCLCFTWVDEDMMKDLQLFRCPECCRETCRDCNDLYEKHCGQLCPAKKKRSSKKTRLEEFASRMRVARKHKCPKCPMRYEKNGGCDHITCGGNTWNDHLFGGCSHEFCHQCKGEWDTYGHAPYCMYYYRPSHILNLLRRIWR